LPLFGTGSISEQKVQGLDAVKTSDNQHDNQHDNISKSFDLGAFAVDRV
jgi:hypothetical protein